MRKVIYQVWTSLDGYAADADHSTKFFEDRKYSEGSDEELLAYMDNIDTILLGANTYKLFAESWPKAGSDTEMIADRLNSTPKIVFSKTLKEAPWGKWPPANIISSDALTALKKMKSQTGKDMVLWGSLSLAKSLMKAKLIDELHVRVVPLLLGRGTSLFEDAGETKLKLVDTKRYPPGIVLLQYVPE